MVGTCIRMASLRSSKTNWRNNHEHTCKLPYDCSWKQGNCNGSNPNLRGNGRATGVEPRIRWAVQQSVLVMPKRSTRGFESLLPPSLYVIGARTLRTLREHRTIATAGQNCGIICVSLKAEGGE